MKRRIFALMAAALMALPLVVLPIFAAGSGSEADTSNKKWRLVESYVYIPDDTVKEYNEFTMKQAYSGDKLTHKCYRTETAKLDWVKDLPGPENFTVSFSSEPPRELTPGEILEIGITAAIDVESPTGAVQGTVREVDFNDIYYPYRGTLIEEKYGALPYDFVDFIVVDDDYVEITRDAAVTSATAKLEVPMPKDPDRLSFCGIRYNSKFGGYADAYTDFIYQWGDDENEPDQRWRLVESYLYTPEDTIDDAIDFVTTMTRSGNKLHHKHYETQEAKFESQKPHDPVTYNFYFSSEPPSELAPGETFEVVISAAIDCTGEQTSHWAGGVSAVSGNSVIDGYKGELADRNAYGVWDFDEFIILDDGGIGGTRYINEVEAWNTKAKLEAPMPEHPERPSFCGVRYRSYVEVGNYDMPIIMYTDFIYQWDGDPGKVDVVVDTSANPEEGGSGGPAGKDDNGPGGSKTDSDGGTDIPALIVIGTLGGGAALAGAAASGGGEKEGGEEKKRSSYKMYINKNFGNQLRKGDAPQAVYARIVEVKPDGSEVHRTDLTQQIAVYSSDNSLNVSDGGMVNGYRCAMASVPDVETPQPEGKVSFYFAGEGGTFTRNVIFNITVPGIQFFQDNLTLPAGALDEPEYLPFVISGMGDKYDVELEYTGDEYEVALTNAVEPEAKDVRFAVFMEKDKQPIEPGVYVEHWLNVTVRNQSQELKASLKIVRMGLGLNISAKAVNCYRVPKQESAGKAMKDMKPGDFDTSVTESQGYLITYDAENHQVLQQPAFPTVTFAPLDNEEPEKKKQISEALARLDIQLKVKDFEDNFSNCVFFCKGGFLDAPTRYFVKMTLSYTVGKITYTREKEVLLRSQPSRFVAGVRENYELDKYDDQITESLNAIKAVIFDYYYNNLFPLYHMIDRMTYGYDRAYGYDPYQVAKVFDVWERFQTGETLGANAEAYKYGIADELEALAAASRSWDGFQGIVMRLSLDVMTGGASEIAFVALDANRAAMDYRNATGGNGTAYGYFKAMALPIALAVVPGGVAKYGKRITGAVGKAANYIAPNKTAALMKQVNMVKGVAKEMTELMVQDAKAVSGYIASKIPQSAKNLSGKIGKAVNEFVEKVDKFDPKLSIPKANRANAVVRAGVNKGRASAEAAFAEAKAAPKTVQEMCMDSAGSATAKQGELVYNELVAAKKALNANPTSGAAQIRYNQAIVEFKASHAAIEHGNSIMKGEQLTMRSTLNADIEKRFAEKIEQKFRTKIANKYNADPATVVIHRASAKSDAAVKYGRDIDWTPDIVTERGGVKPVSQATASEFLEEATHETVEELCGKEYAARFAKKGEFSLKLDQTACTIQHPDYFQGGLPTVDKLTDKAQMAEYIEDGTSVVGTLDYKAEHAYQKGVALERQVMSGLSDSEARAVRKELEAFCKADAAGVRAAGLSEEAKRLMEAYKLQQEGVYQSAKYGRKMIDKECIAMTGGYAETMTARDYTIQSILDSCAGQGSANRSLSEIQYALKTQGVDLGTALRNTGDVFKRINAKLGYGTNSQTLGAVGAGGGLNAVLNNRGGRTDKS